MAVHLTLSIAKGKAVVFLAIYTVRAAMAVLIMIALTAILFIVITLKINQLSVSSAATIFKDITQKTIFAKVTYSLTLRMS